MWTGWVCELAFVEEQEEADRASAKKEVTGIEFKDIAMQRGIVEVVAGNVSRLVAQNIECHHTPQGMSQKMHAALFLEGRVVLAPEAVDTISFPDHRLDHLRFVV